MYQQNSFDISGFDDGTENKLDIPKKQQFNEQNNNIQTNNDNSESITQIKTTAFLKIFSLLFLIASVCFFVAAGIKMDKTYVYLGAVALGALVTTIIGTVVTDYLSSKKMLSYFEKKNINNRCQQECKQESLSEQISIGNKVNKRAKYNKHDYYNKNNNISPNL